MPSLNAIAPSSSTGRFQLSRLSPLTSTLTNFASASPLAPTLTRKLTLKSFRINTYKKGGEGEGGLFASEHELPTTDHESPVKGSNSFRITYICKNASANPYGSHTYKTKDLKPFRITYLQKKGGVAPPFSTGHPARPEYSWQRLVPSMRVATAIIAGDLGLSVQLPTSGLEPPRRHESPVTSHN